MSATTETPKNIHQGRNVKRFREMLGLKQEALAVELGEEWNQKRVSLLEAKEVIEEDILKQVANILKVPVDAIRNFKEDSIFNIIGNTYHDTSSSVQYQCTFNPIEKIVELYDEKVALLERLLQAEKEKNELLKGKNVKN